MTKQQDKTASPTVNRLALLSKNRNEDRFIKNDQVFHPIFGEGIVTTLLFENAQQKAVCIRFKAYGFKWIIAKSDYLPLLQRPACTP